MPLVEFCSAPGAGSCKHASQSVSPWQPALTFQRFRVGFNRVTCISVSHHSYKNAFAKRLGFPNQPCMARWMLELWDLPFTHAQKEKYMTPANRKAVYYSFDLHSAVATSFLPAACLLLLDVGKLLLSQCILLCIEILILPCTFPLLLNVLHCVSSPAHPTSAYTPQDDPSHLHPCNGVSWVSKSYF